MRGVEVQRTRGGWRIVLHGTYPTQQDAIDAAEQLAELIGGELFVRSVRGRWRLRNTYPRWLDPRRSKG